MKLIKNNQEAYMGWHDGRPVWDRGIDKLLATPFYVESRGEAMDVSIKKAATDAPTIPVEYSWDKTTWQSLGSTSTTALTVNVPAGSKVWLRASASKWSAEGSYGYNYITTSSPSNVGGNIMSLLYGDTFTGQLEFPSTSTSYIFHSLFRNGTSGVGNIVDASKLLLPATMLATSCYYGMFRNCSSLTMAPELPATTLTPGCYYDMFYGCTSLTKAPKLPATILADGCYRYMFYGCTNLNYIKCLATDISANNPLASWVSNVASSGTFIKKAGVSWPSGADGIPEGWTVVEE